MILSDEQVNLRLISSNNLLNRLEKTTLRRNPSNVYEVDRLIEDLDKKLSEAQPVAFTNGKSNREKVGDKAAKIILAAMDELESRIPEIQKPEKLATVIRDMSQVVKNTDSPIEDRISDVNFTFIIPPTKTEADFEIIDVT